MEADSDFSAQMILDFVEDLFIRPRKSQLTGEWIAIRLDFSAAHLVVDVDVLGHNGMDISWPNELLCCGGFCTCFLDSLAEGDDLALQIAEFLCFFEGDECEA